MNFDCVSLTFLENHKVHSLRQVDCVSRNSMLQRRSVQPVFTSLKKASWKHELFCCSLGERFWKLLIFVSWILQVHVFERKAEIKAGFRSRGQKLGFWKSVKDYVKLFYRVNFYSMLPHNGSPLTQSAYSISPKFCIIKAFLEQFLRSKNLLVSWDCWFMV